VILLWLWGNPLSMMLCCSIPFCPTLFCPTLSDPTAGPAPTWSRILGTTGQLLPLSKRRIDKSTQQVTWYQWLTGTDPPLSVDYLYLLPAQGSSWQPLPESVSRVSGPCWHRS